MAVITITPCEVRALSLSNEFKDLSDAQIQPVIDDACLQVNAALCPDLGPLIAKNLTAHMLVMRKRKGSGPAGPVSSQSAGKIARAYRTSGVIDKSASAAYFMQSFYGQEYMRLIRLLPATPMATDTSGAILHHP